MNLAERSGYFSGYLLGLFTFVISFLRGARTFHPQGVLYEAVVKSAEFPPHAMVRLSGALWKFKEWPDVLGVAIRFMREIPHSIVPAQDDQDLLLASFSQAWMTPIGPLFTDHHDFLNNSYYGVSPFLKKGNLIKYQLLPKNHVRIEGNRLEKLQEAVLEGAAVFLLQEQEMNKTEWKTVAEIKLTRSLHYDQEALRFHPFHYGHGARPYGFIHHLRIGAYKLSQVARPRSESI